MNENETRNIPHSGRRTSGLPSSRLSQKRAGQPLFPAQHAPHRPAEPLALDSALPAPARRAGGTGLRQAPQVLPHARSGAHRAPPGRTVTSARTTAVRDGRKTTENTTCRRIGLQMSTKVYIGEKGSGIFAM